MAKKGRVGPAIGISGLSSFFGGMVGLTGLMLLARPVSDFALRFGPPEYFGFIPLFVTILKLVQPYLFTTITVLCLTGVYAYSFSFFAAWVMLAFGVIGYFAKKLGYPMAPLVLGLVLGPRTENSLRQSIMMSEGSLSIFIESPIAATLIGMGLIMIIYPIFRYYMDMIKLSFNK